MHYTYVCIEQQKGEVEISGREYELCNADAFYFQIISCTNITMKTEENSEYKFGLVCAAVIFAFCFQILCITYTSVCSSASDGTI